MAPRLRRANQRTKDKKRAATPAPTNAAEAASPLRRSMSEATRRVDEIVVAAEKAAAEIRAEAEEEPRRRQRGRASSSPGKRQAGGSDAASPAAAGAPLRKSLSDARRRVDEVIDAAERAAAEIRAEAEAEASRLIEARREEAAEIRAEAEAEAGRYLVGRRVDADRLVKARRRAVSELSQSLLDHAQGLREGAESLARELEQTVARIREMPDGGDVGEIEPGNPRAAESTPRRPSKETGAPHPERTVRGGHAGTPRPEGLPPRPSPSRRRGADDASEAALLRATQMAVEGSERQEIDRALRRKFGLTDTAPILDEVLGREG